MTNQTGFLGTLRDMSQAQFQTAYLKVTEKEWGEMSGSRLRVWQAEVERRGLGRSLEDTIGEIQLPSSRWLEQRLKQTPSPSTTTTSETESESPGPVNPRTGQPYTREEAREAWENAKRQLLPVARLLGIVKQDMTQSDFVLIPGTEDSLPEASTGSGGTLTASEIVPGVGPVNETALPSSEASGGTPTTAASGYGMVAYQRLPLSAKRDAFIAEGFLYVRGEVLKGWMRHLMAGRCCPAAEMGAGHHSSDCWVR